MIATETCFFRLNIMKWKCGMCGKKLSSKQTAVKHIEVIHKDTDIPISREKSVESTPNQVTNKISNKKKNVCSYFSGLSNVFSSGNFVEDFDWTFEKKKKGNDEKGKYSADKSCSSNEKNETTARAQFVPPFKDNVPSRADQPIQVCNGDSSASNAQPVYSDENDRIPSNTNIVESVAFSTAEYGHEGILSGTTDGEMCSTSLDFLATDCYENGNASINSDIYSHLSSEKDVDMGQEETHGHVVKTRGHCGDRTCLGCNREPCGSCLNCIHKRKKR